MTAALPSCPLCSGTRAEAFLDRPQVPVHQNLLHATRAEARAVRQGRLRMCCCPDCGFVFNASFDPALLSYGPEYNNTQTASRAFDRYTDELADQIVHAAPRGSSVVEVGCGKGGFLEKLLLRAPGWQGIGFDPAYEGELVRMGGRLRFERRFFDSSCKGTPADLLVCRHVIEHIQRPGELLSAVREALAASPHPRLYFETPDVAWILRNGVVWDFFYEHCSLFSGPSLLSALSLAGFGDANVGPVFGGQYLWAQAQRGTASHIPDSTGHELLRLARAFGTDVNARVDAWRSSLNDWHAAGPVALWGAGAKGATFASLVDPDGTMIDRIVDVSAAKHGRFVPGTGHAICPPESLAELRPALILVLNPNYAAEIRQWLQQAGIHARVLDLMTDRSRP